MKNLKNFRVFMVFILCGATLCIGASLAGNFVSASMNSMSLAQSVTMLADFWADANAFIIQNWIWFAVGGGVLILLIILIVCISSARHKKRARLRKEEELARAMELKNGEEPETTDEKIVENPEKEEIVVQPEKIEVESQPQKEEVEVQTVTEPAKPEVAQPKPVEYPANSYEDRKPYPEIMEYIKMKMRMDAERNSRQYAPPQTIEVKQEGVDERVKAVQREYQEELRKIDDILHEQEKEKLREEMQKEQELIDKLEEEYEIADDLLEELNAQDEVKEDKKETAIQEESFVQEPVFEYKIVAAGLPIRPQQEPSIQTQPNEDEKLKQVANDAIVISTSKRPTMREAFKNLPANQKQYFNKLRDYADLKAGSRSKESKNYVVVGCGNKNYIRLTIKRNTVVACFLLESEEMQRLRLVEKLAVKPEETQIKVVDDKTFEIAKQMIDLRVKQIEREGEIVKELRREKRKQNKK